MNNQSNGLYAQPMLYWVCACSVYGCLVFAPFLNPCMCPGCLLTDNSQAWKTFNCNITMLDQYTCIVIVHHSRGTAASVLLSPQDPQTAPHAKTVPLCLKTPKAFISPKWP